MGLQSSLDLGDRAVVQTVELDRAAAHGDWIACIKLSSDGGGKSHASCWDSSDKDA